MALDNVITVLSFLWLVRHQGRSFFLGGGEMGIILRDLRGGSDSSLYDMGPICVGKQGGIYLRFLICVIIVGMLARSLFAVDNQFIKCPCEISHKEFLDSCWWFGGR